MQAAKAAGLMPGGVIGDIVAAREPRVDWVSETREFIVHTTPSNQSWTTPDRRFVAGGLYLPGVTKENLGVIAIVSDTSGSTSHLQKEFAKEVGGIIAEARPERVFVIYCDAVVQSVEEFTADDFDMQYRPKGFGGTRFTPAFDYVRDNGLDVQAMIYLTDLECGDEKNIANDPGYPVLWCCPDYTRDTTVAFGQVVKIPLTGGRQ
jgi:predicted metal-dependent peptidase